MELYDTRTDPGEFRNLSSRADLAKIRGRLENVLRDWQKRTNDFPASRRRRADNVDRITGVKFTRKIGPQVEQGVPKPLR